MQLAQARALGEQRKAARRSRTRRIRKTVAALAVGAFVGPSLTIYQQGRDPGLGQGPKPAVSAALVQNVGAGASDARSAANTQVATADATASSTQAVTPAPVQTQQS